MIKFSNNKINKIVEYWILLDIYYILYILITGWHCAPSLFVIDDNAVLSCLPGNQH
jgi:hypothetical protein